MVPHQPFPAQKLSYPMSWAMSPPLYGHFFPSPFELYPHFMPAPPPFETPRTTMLRVAELDDEGDFEGVFSNYGNPSPLKLRFLSEIMGPTFVLTTIYCSFCRRHRRIVCTEICLPKFFIIQRGNFTALISPSSSSILFK